MNVFAIILFASPVLFISLAAFFVLTTIGIRRGDRGELTRPAENRIDSIGRRAAGIGIRTDARSEEGDR
jgi:hypothetical protein